MKIFSIFSTVVIASNAYGFEIPVGLHCNSNAEVYFTTHHGEGPGCGASGHLKIKSQVRDWGSKTIHVRTTWSPGRSIGPPDTCHYWGPIYGGGKIDTWVGTWKVILDERLVGSYKIERSHSGDPYDRLYATHCKVEVE